MSELQLQKIDELYSDLKRIGVAKGEKLYDDDYDLDEMNKNIAKMFVVLN